MHSKSVENLRSICVALNNKVMLKW